MNPYIQKIIIFFFTLNTSSTNCFLKFIGLAAGFVENVLLKAHKVCQRKWGSLVLVPSCRLRAGHQYCGRWGFLFQYLLCPRGFRWEWAEGCLTQQDIHVPYLKAGIKHTHQPVYSASYPEVDFKREQWWKEIYGDGFLLSPVCLLLLLASSDTCFTRSNVFGWLGGWHRNEHLRSNPGFAAYLGIVSVANHLDSSAFTPSPCALPNPSVLTSSPTCTPPPQPALLSPSLHCKLVEACICLGTGF